MWYCIISTLSGFFMSIEFIVLNPNDATYSAYWALNEEQLEELIEQLQSALMRLRKQDRPGLPVFIYKVSLVDAMITDFEPLDTDLSIISVVPCGILYQ